MAGGSLGVRLGLLTSLLILTRMSLSWDNPDLRAPGVPEQGVRASLWCRKCGWKLKLEVMPSGPIPSCPNHGAIDEEDILTSPPSLWCRKCGSKLEVEAMPSCPNHGAIDEEDILTSPPPPRS
jgi:Zn finger protein HypA/HybF involved in hydrogenase expression